MSSCGCEFASSYVLKEYAPVLLLCADAEADLLSSLLSSRITYIIYCCNDNLLANATERR
jgi:hypothetical protein